MVERSEEEEEEINYTYNNPTVVFIYCIIICVTLLQASLEVGKSRAVWVSHIRFRKAL